MPQGAQVASAFLLPQIHDIALICRDALGGLYGRRYNQGFHNKMYIGI